MLLQWLQVFQLDSQYIAGSDGGQLADDNKSYVFLLYSPQPAATNTNNATSASAPAAASEDNLLIARYYIL